jgi:hypothetical protein
MPVIQNAKSRGVDQPIKAKRQASDSLPLREVLLKIRALNEGVLARWIAPALRGLVLQPLRDHFCAQMGGREVAAVLIGSRQSHASDVSASSYCEGCIKNSRCAYGRVFEPDLAVIDASIIRRGDKQGVRGISIAAEILSGEPIFGHVNSESQDRDCVSVEQCPTVANSEVVVRLLGIGKLSIELLPIVIEAIDAFGQSHGLGYQAPVKYAVDYSQITTRDWQLAPESLSVDTCGGTIPELTLEFQSPLLLKSCHDRGRLVPPTFSELFSNSVRIVSRSIREYHDAGFLETASFGDFLATAKDVASIHENLVPFTQASISHRGDVRSKGYRERPLRGYLGSMTFANVPTSHIPWLLWAGRLGIGSDRNRGAGLWRVEFY